MLSTLPPLGDVRRTGGQRCQKEPLNVEPSTSNIQSIIINDQQITNNTKGGCPQDRGSAMPEGATQFKTINQ